MNNIRFKYPRTPHLPWSAGGSRDDLCLSDTTHFSGREVVVTEKMDGENTTLYHDYLHARSIDGRHHPSRDWIKRLHGEIAHQIPEGWRFCGENLYARHSIAYEDLPGYFLLFSIWNDENRCLNWEDTAAWAARLELPLPSVMYRGMWDEAAIRGLQYDPAVCEGYVVRTAEGFAYEHFARHVAKAVRRGHVRTDDHWMHGVAVPNQLRVKN